MASGKFHGVTIAATPTGSFHVSSRLSLVLGGSTWPAVRRASSAYSRTNAFA
jgi:hypothetical protein